MTISAALRARLDHRHLEPGVRGLDVGPGLRAAHRCAARPAHAPRQHLDHERRQLPPQAIRRPPSRRSQGGAKPGHRRDHRSRYRRDHPSLTETPPRRAKGPPRDPLHVVISCHHWPAFAPPHWPGIRPPLTLFRYRGLDGVGNAARSIRYRNPVLNVSCLGCRPSQRTRRR